MSNIKTEVARIKDAKASLKTAIEGKGVSVPADAHIDAYPALVDAIQQGGGGEEWVRPAEWCDVDKVYEEQYGKRKNCLVLGFACNEQRLLHHVTCKISGAVYNVMLHNASGDKVWTEPQRIANNQIFSEDIPIEYGCLVFYTDSEDVNITDASFMRYTAPNGQAYSGDMCPIVEIVGHQHTGGYGLKTIFHQREKRNFTTLSTLMNMWSGCYSLQVLDMSEWETHDWSINSCNAVFANCYSMHKIDTSSWDTTNWVVTTVLNMFGSVISCQEIDISSWDMANWAVTDARNFFLQDLSLKNIIWPNTISLFENNALLLSANVLIRRESLIGLFNALTPTSAGTKITLGGTIILYLTDDEKAIATSKGYVLA